MGRDPRMSAYDGVVQGDDRAGWRIESAYSDHSKPELITLSYPIIGAAPARGNFGPAPILAPGLRCSYVTGSAYPFPDIQGGKACRWSAYGGGAYLEITAANQGTVAITPIACPKVRAGLETRYYSGRWQKYTKKDGWTAITNGEGAPITCLAEIKAYRTGKDADGQPHVRKTVYAVELQDEEIPDEELDDDWEVDIHCEAFELDALC